MPIAGALVFIYVITIENVPRALSALVKAYDRLVVIADLGARPRRSPTPLEGLYGV